MVGGSLRVLRYYIVFGVFQFHIYDICVEAPQPDDGKTD
jgi:hypothetical protein